MRLEQERARQATSEELEIKAELLELSLKVMSKSWEDFAKGRIYPTNTRL